MDVAAAKLIAAGLALIALAGVGVGLGLIFSAWITALGRNPSAGATIRGMGFLGFALTEAIAIFALGIAFMILFVF